MMQNKLSRFLAVVLAGAAIGVTAADDTGAGGLAKTLPEIPKGKWQGKHAVYKQQNFNAYMDVNGILWIQCLDNGKDVGKPFSCYQVNAVYYPPKSHQHGRPVIGFENPPGPRMIKSGEKLALKGRLKEDIPFEVQYEFRNNMITACGGCKDHGGISFPTTFRLASIMRKSHEIPEQMEQEDREKMLQGCLLVTKENVGGRKKSFKYPYYDILDFHGSVESAEVRGTCGRRVIQFKPRKIRGQFLGYAYESYCPWQGYWIYYRTKGDKIDLRNSLVTMTIK